MTTEDIVATTDGASDRELTRISGIHNHLLTWAVHDDRVCVYLAVTPRERIYAGVFCCTAGDDNDCPWLGKCDTDAYLSNYARPIYDEAAASGWDETVIYDLLDAMHTREVADAPPTTEEPDRTLTAVERRAESEYIPPLGAEEVDADTEARIAQVLDQIAAGKPVVWPGPSADDPNDEITGGAEPPCKCGHPREAHFETWGGGHVLAKDTRCNMCRHCNIYRAAGAS